MGDPNLDGIENSRSSNEGEGLSNGIFASGLTELASQNLAVKGKLGHVDLVEEVAAGVSKIVKIKRIKNLGQTTTVMVRGSNQLVLVEAERILHDTPCEVSH
ncbi:hypothetical protein SUGI_1118000 [Cryptomeria japonica]|nr:hypothetical protein SUGI_1118000 [Cryptomeria japonica]